MKKQKTKLIYAKDCKCIRCGKPAVCFWPIVDPDIKENPYCRKCVTNAQYDVLKAMNQKPK